MKDNSLFLYAAVALSLVIMELGYFHLARRFNILDKPNLRSSHYVPVVRGGGIIFLLSTWMWFVMEGFAFPAFVAGITAAGFISFMDDVRSQRRALRFSVHVLAIALMFYDAGIYSWSVWLVALSAVVCIGTLNAFNFMDGINGITGVYAMVCLATFLYIQTFYETFTSVSLITTSAVAVGVFLIFNFRRKAACFAGDVGSVTIAFILIFLLLQLIVESQSFYWVMLFLVYGIDSVVTIMYRIRARENIFDAHRQHLYQYLSNEIKWPHRAVSLLYGLVQMIVNAVAYWAISNQQTWLIYTSGMVMLAIYVGIREYVLKTIRFNHKITN